MAADAVTLPPGFVLDGPQPQPPPGFVLDDSEIRLSNPTEPSLWQGFTQGLTQGFNAVGGNIPGRVASQAMDLLERGFAGAINLPQRTYNLAAGVPQPSPNELWAQPGKQLIPPGTLDIPSALDLQTGGMGSLIEKYVAPKVANFIGVPELGKVPEQRITKFGRQMSREVERQSTPGNIGLMASGLGLEKTLGSEALALASKIFGPYFGVQALSQVPEKVRQGDYGGAAVDIGIGAAGTVGPAFMKDTTGPVPIKSGIPALEQLKSLLPYTGERTGATPQEPLTTGLWGQLGPAGQYKAEPTPGQSLLPRFAQTGIEGKTQPSSGEVIQLPQMTTQPRLVVDPAGRVVDFDQLTEVEQRELTRGPKEYQQPREGIRPSQQTPPVIGQRPISYEDAPRPTPEIVKPGPTFKGEPKQGGQVSFEGQGVPSAMQAKQMVPPTKYRSGPSVDPEDLRPAINFGGRLLIGEKGDTHADVLERNGIKPDDIPHPDSRRGFASVKNPQQFLDRSQAQQATGIKGTADAGGLDSMDLPGASMHRLEALMKKQDAKTKFETMRQETEKPQPPLEPKKVGRDKDKFDVMRKATEGETPYFSGIAPEVFRKREEELRGGLFLSTPRLMTTAKEIGFTDTTKEVDAQQLWNRVRNRLPAEAKMLEEMGVDKMVTGKGKISPQEAAKLVQENGPRVEIKKYDLNPKERKNEFAQERVIIEHELDTIQPNWRDIPPQQWGRQSDVVQNRLLRLREMDRGSALEPRIGGERITARFSSIASKHESEMPGYVEGIVTTGGETKYTDETHFRGTKNPLGFFRGYMETTPEGKKVFHVLEVQSDWAQHVRNVVEASRDDPRRPGEVAINKYQQEKGHPLLKHWERLTLKAAVEHALKEGADEVAVQDAESAMMMEGHDRISQLQEFRTQNVNRIRQEEGMRLHYDRILPGIMKELTGQEGKKVSFGEHKMAMDTVPNRIDVEGNPRPGIPRKDLIFRNPDSTPKIDVSALSYPLKDVKPPMSLLEKDKPAGRPTYYYSGIPLPELEKAWDSMKKWFVGTVEPKAAKWSPMITPDTMRRELLSKDSTANPISSKQVGLTLPSAGPDTTFGDRLAATGDAFKKAIALTQDLVNKGDKIYSPMDVIFDRLDGGKATFDGPLFRNVRWPLDFDFNNELNLRQKHTDPVKQLIDKYKLKDKNGQRLGVYAAVQQGARDRLIANGVSSTYIDNVLKTLTPQEKEVYRVARRQLDSLLPGVQTVAKDVYGIDVQPVENYFPMQRDWRQTKKEAPELVKPRGGVDPIQDEAVQFLNLDFTKRGTKAEQGFTQKRVPNAKTAVKLNFFDVYERHVRDVAHFVSSQKRLNDIAKIVRDDAFQEKYGDFGQKLTMDWLNTYAKQGRNVSTLPIVDVLRKAEARGVLGFRVASQFVHLANVPLGMQRAGPVWYSHGLHHAVTEEGQNFIRKNLAETFERGGGELELLEKQGPVSKAAFAPQRQLDRWNSQATSLGIYLRELDKKGVDYRDFSTLPVDQQALAQARVLTRRAVASPLYKDLPPALTHQTGKVLMQFQNTFMDQWSNIRYDLPQYLQNNPRQAMGLFVALAGMVLVESGIKHEVKKGEHALTGYHPKTEREDTYWKKVYHETLRRVPGYSQVSAMSEFGSSGVPLVDIAKEGAKAVKTTVTAEDKASRELGAVQAGTTALELAGVPGTGQASTLIQDAIKAKEFKPHEQRIEEYAKEKNLDLSQFPQRVQAEREYKTTRPPQSEAEKVKGAQGAIKKMAGHRQEAINQLSKEDRTWLKANGVEPPGFGDALTVSKVRVTETEAEVEYAEKRYAKAYGEAIAFLRNHDGFKQGDQAKKQVIANKVFHDFLKSAKQEVTAKVESGELVKKEKKKRFSVFSQE